MLFSLAGLALAAALAGQPPLALMGGGTDQDEAFHWLAAQANGGRVVVIRASGTDAYNAYIRRQGASSVETIVFRDRAMAQDPAIAARIRSADALFIAGGDQWNYVRYWKGTPVGEALQELAAKGHPMGGTSAGLAVLGEFAFSAQHGTVRSGDALANPYDPMVALERDFLHLAPLAGIVTDTHFVERDRMGRLLVFLARIVQDGWAKTARGIGVDRETAVLVERGGQARVVGRNAAFFLRTSAAPAICRPGTPLTLPEVKVIRVQPGGHFDLGSWSSPDGVAYGLSVQEGKVVSTQAGGRLY